MHINDTSCVELMISVIQDEKPPAVPKTRDASIEPRTRPASTEPRTRAATTTRKTQVDDVDTVLFFLFLSRHYISSHSHRSQRPERPAAAPPLSQPSDLSPRGRAHDLLQSQRPQPQQPARPRGPKYVVQRMTTTTMTPLTLSGYLKPLLPHKGRDARGLRPRL